AAPLRTTVPIVYPGVGALQAVAAPSMRPPLHCPPEARAHCRTRRWSSERPRPAAVPPPFHTRAEAEPHAWNRREGNPDLTLRADKLPNFSGRRFGPSGTPEVHSSLE